MKCDVCGKFSGRAVTRGRIEVRICDSEVCAAKARDFVMLCSEQKASIPEPDTADEG